jgi:hypothetical protein
MAYMRGITQHDTGTIASSQESVYIYTVVKYVSYVNIFKCFNVIVECVVFLYC